MGLFSNLKSSASKGKNKYNNTLSSFDNEIESTKSKASSKITSLKSLASGLKDKLIETAKNVGSEEISMFNKLKTLASGKGFSSLLNKLIGSAKGFADQLKESALQMVNDSLTTLQNATQNFVGNIAESIYNDLKKFIYIPDGVFVVTIKALYYIGGDLAYKSSYLRNQALSRDWIFTLKFCDQEYGIKYDAQYTTIKTDLNKCTKNGAWQNTQYIFGQMNNYINEYNQQITKYSNELATMDEKAVNYKSTLTTKKNLDADVAGMKKIMIAAFKDLITYSYSNFQASDCKDFFTNFKDILKPKYYGTSDIDYGQQYSFTASDVSVMMPYYSATNSESKTDKITENNVNNEANDLTEDSDDLAISKSKNSEQSDAYKKTTSIIEKYRSNSRKSLKDRSKTLTKDAVTKGSGAVLTDSRARYNLNTSQGNNLVVKYNSGWTNITGFVSAIFDSDKYVSLRNNNIKAIYILLTSKAIFGEDVMINQNFYERCKLKTMTKTMSALDKARGILGSSSLVQGALDLGNLQDALIYNYIKRTEKFLFTPGKNNALDSSALNVLTSYGINYSASDDAIILPSTDTTLPKTVYQSSIDSSLQVLADSEKESGTFSYPATESSSENTNCTTELESSIKTNTTNYQSLLDIIRFLNNLPMLSKKDLLDKYLSKFYTIMVNKNVDNTILTNTFAYLIYCVFGQKGISTPSETQNIYNYSSDETLYNNIKDLMSMYILSEKIPEYLHLTTYSTEIQTLIKNIFKSCMYIMAYEIKSLSFLNTVYNYDEEHYKSLAKQSYISQITYLKSINSTTNSLYSSFYNTKDKLSQYFSGFDKAGIIGYDNSNDLRVKYTNIRYGDWNSILVATDGTFFGGDDNTNNNGIKYLNTSTNEINSTDVKSGIWNIEEHNGITFFIDNTNNKFYYWNNSTNKPNIISSITDISNWSLFSEESTGVIALISKVDSGIKLWNSSSCSFISTSASSGGLYTGELTNAGVIFYSSDISSGVYLCDFTSNTNLATLSSTSRKYTGLQSFKETITATITPPSSIAVPVVTTTYVYHILMTSGSDLVELISAESLIDGVYTTFTENVISLGNSDTESYINAISGAIYIVSDKGRYSVTIRQTFAYSGTAVQQYQSITAINTISTSNNSNIGVYKDNLIVYVSNNKLYKFNGSSTELSISCDDLTKLSYTTINNYLFIIYINDNVEDIYYCPVSANSVTSIFTDNTYKKTGWIFDNANESNVIFLLNNNNSLGINYFDISTKTLIPTNISSGKWIVANASNKFLALSCYGTNLGIKATVSMTNLSFAYTTENAITYNDFKPYSYDYSKNILYIGTYRKNTLFNFDNVTFDIDEFVFNANIYQLNKILKYCYQDMAELSLNLADKLISEFDSISSSSGGSSSGETESIKTLSEKFEDLYSLLTSSIGTLNTSLDLIIKSSAFYTDLLLNAQAKTEFDVDDVDSADSVLSDLISNSTATDPNAFNQLLSFIGSKQKYYIQNASDESLTLEINSPAWNKINDYNTDDFLNED